MRDVQKKERQLAGWRSLLSFKLQILLPLPRSDILLLMKTAQEVETIRLIITYKVMSGLRCEFLWLEVASFRSSLFTAFCFSSVKQ